MTISRTARKLVALLAALMLLGCQTAAAAEACAHGFTSAPAKIAATPCHEAETGAPADEAPAAGACQAAKAIADQVKAPVFTLADLPSVLVAYLETAEPTIAVRSLHAVSAVCSSPPSASCTAVS